MTAFLILGEICGEVSRMRLSLPVSLATWVRPLPASSTEFLAARYSALFSSAGRSLATAMSIPKTVETPASSVRPTATKPRRSFLSLRLGGGGGGLPSTSPTGPRAGVGRTGTVGVVGDSGIRQTEGGTALRRRPPGDAGVGVDRAAAPMGSRRRLAPPV